MVTSPHPSGYEAIEPIYSKWGRLPRARRAGVLGGVVCESRLGVVSSLYFLDGPRLERAARTPPPDREG